MENSKTFITEVGRGHLGGVVVYERFLFWMSGRLREVVALDLLSATSFKLGGFINNGPLHCSLNEILQVYPLCH